MKAKIKAISYYLPEKILTNEELIKDFPEWNADKISAKIGIEERRISADDETAGDMAIKAANKLFAEHNISPEEIGVGDPPNASTMRIDVWLFITRIFKPSRSLGVRTGLSRV